jgi:hypothetical protein
MAMNLEQFEAFYSTLPEGADKRKLAKALGLSLPVEVKPLTEQLAGVAVIKHTTKSNKERTYISVPNLQLGEEESARGFWVSTTTARKVAERILEVCDANNL